MVLKLALVDNHKKALGKGKNTKSVFFNNSNRVKQKSESKPGYSSKKPGKC